MAKKKFWNPVIIHTQAAGEDSGSLTGGGTGTAIPGGEGEGETYDFLEYDIWKVAFEDLVDDFDTNDNGYLDWDDYLAWLKDNGYGDLIPSLTPPEE